MSTGSVQELVRDSSGLDPYIPPVGWSAAQLKQLLDALPAGAYTCDAEGLITYFNGAAVEVWGRAPKLFDAEDRYCGSFRMFFRNGKPIKHDECWMAKALKEQKGYNGQELIVEQPDGARRIVLAHANPLYDHAGAVVGAVNVLVDITEREQSREETSRASSFLKTLVQASPLPIMVLDADLPNVRLWNPAAEDLFGWTEREILGKSLPIVPEELMAEDQARWVKLKKGMSFSNVETLRCTKTGASVPVSFSAAPLYHRGKISSVLLIFIDETTRKRTEEALKNADRSKDEFLATLAHELRNPLAPLRNAIEILDLKGVPTPEAQWALEIMNRQMQQMTRLIDDLLDIARITGNKLELRRERLALSDVLHVAVETSRPLIESSGHELVESIPEDDVFVNGDLVRLAQVVSNLLNNAAKYTEERGKIWLSLETRGSFVYVTVRDSGIGISAEMMPRIFDMFTQAHTKTHRTGGLGVGLTLAKRLVDMHDGTITVASEGAGNGSTFAVRLPIMREPGERGGRRKVREPQKMPSMRILVVDDNEDSVATLEMMLRMNGHDIRTARDGVQAVDMANRFRPDVVLLDIGMPRMNGYEAAETIRKQSWGVDMVLIALTGWGQDTDREKTTAAGFSHHLVKPVDPAVLSKLLMSVAVERGA